ncbi:MAG: TerB N-terminal domain-containing protein [Clostridia bacterium]|nr:TerB N-terminal domain-containing protein [Clostridia bacterium]
MAGNNDGDYRVFLDVSLEINGSKRYRKPPEPDTGTVEIENGTDADDGGEKIVRINAPSADSAQKHPFVTSSYKRSAARFNSFSSRREGTQGELVEKRTCSGPFVTELAVYDWGGNYSFYEKFLRDAERFRDIEGRESPHVPFFSYIPQYSQMNSSQSDYYFWLRTCVRNGTYPMADISYILLLIYETINLCASSDNVRDAELLGRLWSAYRSVYPILDKYLSEWMADYCMTASIRLPEYVFAFLPKIVERSTLKEFYIEEAFLRAGSDGSNSLSECLIEAYSDYDLSRSRYLREDPSLAAQTKEIFRTVTDKMRAAGKGIFSKERFRRVTLNRDVYSGSLCSCSVKKRLTVTLNTPFRSPETRKTVTELLRFAENAVRKTHGIRSRLSVTGLDPAVLNIAERTGEIVCRPPEEEYLSKYDAPDGAVSIDDAIVVENTSWENTEILTEGADETENGRPVFDEPDGALVWNGEHGDETEEEPADADGVDASPLTVLRRIDGNLWKVLREATGSYGKSGDTLFESHCRELGLFPDSAASAINDVFADMTGDVILEAGDGGYTLIEDYADDLIELFRNDTD